MSNFTDNYTYPQSDYRVLTNEERIRQWIRSSSREFKKSWLIFRRNKLAVLGLILLLIFILMALLHPLLIRTVWPKSVYHPIVGHDISIFPHPALFSRAHLLGTDTLGRDVLSILMAATAPSLTLAFSAAISAAFIGILVGAFSAFFRGWIDSILTHIGDISLLAPAPLVMVVIGFMFDITPVKFGLIYGILVGFGAVGIVLRSHALVLMKRTFVEAAVVAGGGPAHIIARHLIPHLLPLAAVNMLLTVTGAIFASGFIAFLGLSRAQLNWGSMIYDSITYLGINGTITWNVLVPSAMAISLFASSFYFIALGLHDVVDPRLSKNRELSTDGRLGIPESNQELLNKTDTKFHEGSVEMIPATYLCFSISDKGGRILSEKELRGYSLLLQEYGAMVSICRDGRLMAGFGIISHLPSRAGAIMAIEAGFEIVKRREQNNLDSMGSPIEAFKLSIGIASIQTENIQPGQMASHGMNCKSNPCREASTLEHFARSTINGTVLINEQTFILMSSVRDQYSFGRQGMADIPGFETKKMIYEILGARN